LSLSTNNKKLNKPFLISFFWLCRKPDFVHFFVDLKKYEGDPLSPPEGEAAQGAYPLDPLLSAIWLTL
jgi:hypothetical protein